MDHCGVTINDVSMSFYIIIHLARGHYDAKSFVEIPFSSLWNTKMSLSLVSVLNFEYRL